jgi:hypothetical protein
VTDLVVRPGGGIRLNGGASEPAEHAARIDGPSSRSSAAAFTEREKGCVRI